LGKETGEVMAGKQMKDPQKKEKFKPTSVFLLHFTHT